MSMRDQDQINALERCDFLVASVVNGIRQPRIDKKHVAGGRNDFKCRLPIPGELRLRHVRHEIENTDRSKYFS
jgi:hypothetical protein